jgi:hypothetical protein
VSIPGGCIVSVVNDLDGDGLADAVAAGGGTNKISVLHGTDLAREFRTPQNARTARGCPTCPEEHDASTPPSRRLTL